MIYLPCHRKQNADGMVRRNQINTKSPEIVYMYVYLQYFRTLFEFNLFRSLKLFNMISVKQSRVSELGRC